MTGLLVVLEDDEPMSFAAVTTFRSIQLESNGTALPTKLNERRDTT